MPMIDVFCRVVSAAHGTKLLGPGCVILSQSFKYPSPCK